MFPKQKQKKGFHYQQGFLLPLALFILVVMGALALTISRTAVQTNTSSIQELVNIQAFYAAESGAQRGMQGLFLNNANRQAVDAACATMGNNPINHNFPGVDGLRLCNVQVTCGCVYRDNTVCNSATAANYVVSPPLGVAKSFYNIRSVGSCGQQEFRAIRTIEARAFLDQ